MSCVHIAIVVLTALTTMAHTNTQTVFSGVISLAIAILLVLKMVYQMSFNSQADFDVHCNSSVRNFTFFFRSSILFSISLSQIPNENDTSIILSNSTSNTTFVVNNPNNNTANWIGFHKLVSGQTLMDLLSNYIIFIVGLTFYNIILLMQQRKR